MKIIYISHNTIYKVDDAISKHIGVINEIISMLFYSEKKCSALEPVLNLFICLFPFAFCSLL